MLKIRIVKDDGTMLSSQNNKDNEQLEEVSIINIPFDSVWMQIDVYLQQKLISKVCYKHDYIQYGNIVVL